MAALSKSSLTILLKNRLCQSQLNRPVTEKQAYKSRFPPVMLIANIILIVSTILGLFTYYLLQYYLLQDKIKDIPNIESEGKGNGATGGGF